jgi:hypothetical protein
MPAAAIYGRDGRPLLSWRVAILPQIEEHWLFKQFKLDEPWDSEHNKKLLERMPKVYAPVGGNPKEPYSTFYRVFTGPNTPFPGREPSRFPASFLDGTSQTILIVEAAEAVPWTKPDELVFDPSKPMWPLLGGVFAEGAHVALADGSTRFLDRKRLTEKTLHAAITPAGNEVLGLDW